MNGRIGYSKWMVVTSTSPGKAIGPSRWRFSRSEMISEPGKMRGRGYIDRRGGSARTAKWHMSAR